MGPLILVSFVLGVLYWAWILSLGALVLALVPRRRRLLAAAAGLAVLGILLWVCFAIPPLRTWVFLPVAMPILILIDAIGVL